MDIPHLYSRILIKLETGFCSCFDHEQSKFIFEHFFFSDFISVFLVSSLVQTLLADQLKCVSDPIPISYRVGPG